MDRAARRLFLSKSVIGSLGLLQAVVEPAIRGRPTVFASGAFVPAPESEAERDPLPRWASRRLGSVRVRHAGDIPAICFSPNGQTILAGSAQTECAVYLWDATDGTRRHRISVA